MLIPILGKLVASAEQWLWSRFRHYLSGVEGAVEIESQWTVRKPEQLGPTQRVGVEIKIPALSVLRTQRQGRGTRKRDSREGLARPDGVIHNQTFLTRLPT